MLKLQLQQDYFKDALQKCGTDQKKKWKLIREFWPSAKSAQGKISEINGKTSDLDMANEINNLFC